MIRSMYVDNVDSTHDSVIALDLDRRRRWSCLYSGDDAFVDVGFSCLYQPNPRSLKGQGVQDTISPWGLLD